MIKDKLIKELIKFGYPVFLQGTLSPDAAYPETFVTFWTDDTMDNSHYDNEAATITWDFSVIFYSSNPELVNTKPEEIRKALKQAGFIPQGRGRDIPSDEPTHTGWAQDYYFIEQIGGNENGSGI